METQGSTVKKLTSHRPLSLVPLYHSLQVMPFSPMRLLGSTPGNSAVRFGTRSFAPLSSMIGLPCFRDAFFLGCFLVLRGL